MSLMNAANYQKTNKNKFKKTFFKNINNMKNNKIKLSILAVAIISLIGVYSFNAAYSFEKNTKSAGYSIPDSTVTKTYTCPMHPEVISDKPGKCPKCGMDLELKENNEKSDVKEDVENDKGMDHKDCKGCMHKH